MPDYGLLAAQGRGGDTMLAHINPEEAKLLKLFGGSGGINPNTGLHEFRPGGDAGTSDAATGGAFDGGGSAGGGGGARDAHGSQYDMGSAGGGGGARDAHGSQYDMGNVVGNFGPGAGETVADYGIHGVANYDKGHVTDQSNPNFLESLFGIEFKGIRGFDPADQSRIGTNISGSFSPLGILAGAAGGPLGALAARGVTSAFGDPTSQDFSFDAMNGAQNDVSDNDGFGGHGDGGSQQPYYPPLLQTTAPAAIEDPVAPAVLTPYEHLKQQWAGNQFMLAPIRRQS
jgi:hypothetical protein